MDSSGIRGHRPVQGGGLSLRRTRTYVRIGRIGFQGADLPQPPRLRQFGDAAEPGADRAVAGAPATATQREVGEIPGRGAAGLGGGDGLPAGGAGEAGAAGGDRAGRLRLRAPGGARRGLRRVRRRAARLGGRPVAGLPQLRRGRGADGGAEGGRRARREGGDQHARLPPLLRRGRGGGVRAGGSAPGRRRTRCRRDRARVRGGRGGAAPLQPPQPGRRHAGPGAARGDRGGGRRPRRLGPGGRDPRLADAARRRARPLPHRLRSGRRARGRLLVGLEGLQPGGARLRRDRHRLGRGGRSRRAPPGQCHPMRPPRCDRLDRRLPRRRSVAGRRPRRPRPQPPLPRGPARGAPARGRLRAGPGPATWPGSTCAPSTSAPTPRSPSSTAAESPSAQAPSSAPRAAASPA